MTTDSKIVERWDTTKDGTQIYSKTWKAASEPPTATVVFLHGYGEHINRYDHVFEKFSEKNVEVYAFDQRGFGQTAMKNNNPGAPSEPKVVIDDITDALVAQRRPGIPQFLMGHSMGGGYALVYSCEGPERNNLAGFVSCSPLIQQIAVNGAVVAIGTAASKVLPNLTIPVSLNPKIMSHDPEAIKRCMEDPLMFRSGTLRGIRDMLCSSKITLEKKYQNITSPVYICHGSADMITCPKASRKLYEKIPSKDKTFREWEGLYHEMHNETERDKVIDDYLQWILVHANKKSGDDDDDKENNTVSYSVNNALKVY